ncbi:hypothetical protein BABINDRAFT_29947 [Babjeviella inositovora NRRL Y-12698]|uniref:Amino acid transporter transmembrane domain-containing protein n=1 Tax=Babjeviella inositovora NRRL Y-12698 TaxID=984486 RepID=A0A1E3R023_9ASCO|nr:uncharacterized protein BABINDRAFT_29947 [Babjeviella inositovora NRRL Y-12698]ODQ82697.1 hypothetical protein BABINDRAFT_29947 [Babjeviella inositovora NRRL Y-12698]
MEIPSRSSDFCVDDYAISLRAVSEDEESILEPIVKAVSKHLVLEVDDLQLQGGDTTREVYKIAKPRITRSLSVSDFDRERRGSTASLFNVPGGFRRQFIENEAQKHHKKVNFVTLNFLEFLSVYGHFAGEDLEDDDYTACSLVPRFRLDEETPLLTRSRTQQQGTASATKAYFLLLKAFVGTGVLFLPKGFYNGGILFSSVTLFAFGMLSYWCYLILVRSKTATSVSSFGDIGKKLYGTWFKFLILFSITVSQVGFCAAYIAFTSENFRAFIINVSGYDMDPRLLTLVQCLFFVPISMIRDITKLSLSAVIANLFIMMGLGVIFTYCGAQIMDQGVAKVQAFNPESFSLFIGVCIFAFEGIGLILPIQESLKHPEQFPRILFLVIITISFVFILSGCLGYAAYGDNVQTLIIMNLPQGSYFVRSIQLFYSVAILLSSPLQMFPAIRILELKVFGKQSGKYSFETKWRKNSFRAAFVVFTSCIAWLGGGNLDKFVSFIGCFACIPLVYMYPPLLHLRSCATSKWSKASDLALVVVGFVAMVYTTWQILAG